MAETVSDVVLAALLVLSVVWSALVHRRLTRLRADRSELESFITALAGATDRAEAAIGGLRGAGGAISRDLQAQEETARRSIDQLTRQLDAASRTIRRLEQLQQGQGSRPAERSDRSASSRSPAQPERTAEAKPPSSRPDEADAAASRIPADVMRVLQALR